MAHLISRSGARACAGAAALWAAVAIASSALAQSAPAFTDEQADDGAATYAIQCAACHGPELQGGPFGPPLKGSAFEGRWGGAPLDELFGYIRASMPPAAVGQLGDETYAAVLAHVLRANGAEPGDVRLAADFEALADMAAPGEAVSGQEAIRESAFFRVTPGIALPDWPLPPNPLDAYTPVTQATLSAPPSGEWLSWRRGYGGQGFSPLNQITAENVDELQLAWSLTLPAGPNTVEPLMHDGALFVYGYGDRVFALDATSGDELWRYERHLPENTTLDPKRVIALWDDKLYIATSDAHVVALDAKTGRVVWDRAVAPPPHRITGGPLVANGVVMQGTTSTNIPGGGHITALDAETGEELWRFQTIAQPGEPGGNTWNGVPAEERSGGSVWTSGTYDPELDLAYYGVAPTYDTGPLRFPSDDPDVTNDALYTDATLAIRPRTGELVWYYQHMKNDQWDMDWAFERVLFDAAVDGETRRVLTTSGKEGWFDILDAATGGYVGSFEMGIQNFITGIDPETGEKDIDPALLPGGLDHDILVCPWGGGGRNWMPTAFDAEARVLYGVAVEACMNMAPLPEGETSFFSTDVAISISPPPDSDGLYGRLQAMNVDTGETAWLARRRAPPTTGVLATAGGVVFNGALDRVFAAYDAATGDTLWSTGLPEVPNGTPIAYEIDGRQYIAVVTGYGSPTTVTWPDLVPEITLPPVRSSAVFVFALPEE